jgi:hypothetical protein
MVCDGPACRAFHFFSTNTITIELIDSLGGTVILEDLKSCIPGK